MFLPWQVVDLKEKVWSMWQSCTRTQYISKHNEWNLACVAGSGSAHICKKKHGSCRKLLYWKDDVINRVGDGADENYSSAAIPFRLWKCHRYYRFSLKIILNIFFMKFSCACLLVLQHTQLKPKSGKFLAPSSNILLEIFKLSDNLESFWKLWLQIIQLTAFNLIKCFCNYPVLLLPVCRHRCPMSQCISVEACWVWEGHIH